MTMEEMVSHLRQRARFRLKMLVVQLKRLKRLALRVRKTAGNHPEITSSSGTSYAFGKQETLVLIEQMLPDRSTGILDVGPGRGKYGALLRERGYRSIDAVEIYGPYIESFGLSTIYDKVHHMDVADFKYDFYDVVIFGDVLEHLTVKKAQAVTAYAKSHSALIIVSVPYLLPQIGGQLDGSGDHRQPDLTRDLFLQRFPGFVLLADNDQIGVFYLLTGRSR
jgi:2-polyprenyl-3-methyl-5-hydroxy-6-metoxy-1,4-benzoquinol methylase